MRTSTNGPEAVLHEQCYTDQSDLFDLCKIALEKGWTDSGSPLLSADGLRDAVVARYEVLGDDRKLELLNDYGVMWREWIYAMKKMAS